MTLSPELAALRDEATRTSCESWAIQRRWRLSGRGELVGPCPNPDCGGGGGVDRFSINARKNVFNCRKCGISGEGVISLVMATEHVEFIAACEIITGRKAADPIDEDRMAENRRLAEAAERRRVEDERRYRERARLDGNAIWKQGARLADDVSAPLRAYLGRRAIDSLLDLPAVTVLRYHAELPWTEEFTDDNGNRGWRTLHVGPAQLAAVQLPDHRFGAVHMTWIDLDQPKGKLLLPADEKGKPRPPKKVRGAKKGGAIRLFTPERPTRLVMGEGVETTATPLCHAPEPHTAYWAGIDVGNMAGKALKIDGRLIHDQPDMDDIDCFLPPDWCEELVYLGEGDDDTVHSLEKCIRGLRRAKRLREAARLERPELSPLSIVYVPPGETGKDLNDLAMEEVASGLGDTPAGVGEAAASGE